MPSFDGQFGHIFTWGDTRKVAIDRMQHLLNGITIDGDVFNTKDFLRMVIMTDDFQQQRHHTQWLHSNIINHIKQSIDVTSLAICAAVTLTRKQYEVDLVAC
jgi:acetyl-CoA carboxylase/biotin carboxylase 1